MYSNVLKALLYLFLINLVHLSPFDERLKDTLDEYEEKLAEHSCAEVAHNVVEAIAALSTTTMQNTYVHFELLPGDADDNKFVDCAIASNAELIVTNDNDFNPLKSIPWPKIEIMTIMEFTKVIM